MSPIQRIFRKVVGPTNGSAHEARAPREHAAAHGAGSNSHRYFFINGHPRSGTNWLSAITNLHPHLYCHGEFHFHILRQAMDGFTSLPWYLAHHEPVRSEAERGFEDLVRRCLSAQASKKPGALVVGDHTPRPMRAFLPEAKYLLIRRDGRDVLTSWTYHLVRTGKPEVVQEPVRSMLGEALGPNWNGTTAGKDAIAAIGRDLLSREYWVRHFAQVWSQHVLRDEHTREQWTQLGGKGPSVLALRYEDLHADAEGWRTRVYEFLGVDPALAAPLASDSKTAPGFGREDPTSFYRKGEVGDWKNHLSADAQAWFVHEAREAMTALGYADAERVPSGVHASGSDASLHAGATT